MSKESLKITVEGECGTGKSTMMYLIQRMLQLHGFKVDVMDGEMESYLNNPLTLRQWNAKMQWNLSHGAIQGIMSKYNDFDYGPIQISEKYSEID